MSDEITDLIDQLQSVQTDSEIEVRSDSEREIDVRLLTWNTTFDTSNGPEEFRRGSFAGVPNDGMLLMGLEHEAHFGLDQNSRPTMTRRPNGRSMRVWEADDGPRATFRVARTQSGDEILALASDRVIRGVSVEFKEVPGGTSLETRGGRRVRVYNRVAPSGASLTYRPAFGEQAVVLAVRSQDEEGVPEVAESPQEAPAAAAAPALDLSPITGAVVELTSQVSQMRSVFDDRIGAIEEQNRANFTIPTTTPDKPEANRGQWMHAVVDMLAGGRVSESEMRTLGELITSDNVGVVPDAFSREIIGIIDPRRPFLQTTRRIDLPPAGMTITVPKIVTRAATDVQDEEKDPLKQQNTSITQASFDAVTIGGYGDISLQLLRRSSPSYLDLYLELLAEALAANADQVAVDTLLAHYGSGGVQDGGFLDPENLTLGDAWANAAAVNLTADTMWLSTASVSAFIDAKADTTNMPMYTQLQAGFSVPGGTGGTIAGLRPVWVPALDNTSADVVIGPSRGFVWTEDGAITLQVDNPAKAGRDVALVSIFWFAPMYESAFTGYTLSFS